MPKRRESKKKILGIPGRGSKWFGVNRRKASSPGRKGSGKPPGEKKRRVK